MHFSAVLINAEGECSPDDWLDRVKPNILERMADYEEDQIEFSILGLVRDPLPDLVDALAINVKSLELVNDRLHANVENGSDSALTAMILEKTVLGTDRSYDLTREVIDQTRIPSDQEEQYWACSTEELVQRRQKLCIEQQGLRAKIREEQQSHRADDDYAAGRRYDYGPAVRSWVRFLARKRMMEDLL